MHSNTLVEIAERYSRKRAMLVAVAALAFIVIHVALGPFFTAAPDTAHFATTGVMWTINAMVLFAGLATGGGIFNSKQIRLLVNDEVAQSNYRAAVVAGYWVAMLIAMGLYLVPSFARFNGREVVHIIVTASIGVALLAFSYLELRAHSDA